MENICEDKSDIINYDEMDYLNLLKDILENGVEKPDRTDIGTRSLFAKQLKFKLYEESNDDIILSLLTTKRTFFRGIVEELLLFIRGDVDTNKLANKGINIWRGNTTREFLDNNNLKHIEEGSLGKGYSFQWRSWGADYISNDYNHKEHPKAIDQLKMIVNLLRNNKYSRRIILNAWNVSDLKDMALPPCHMDYHFIVIPSNKENAKDKLNCVMHQRSGDMFLGVPFNICSTALFTILLSKITNLQPGEICINIDDAHIYKNHIDQCNLQINRSPYKFPKLEILKKLNDIEDLENMDFKDFKLIDYKYHKTIKANMVV